MALATRGCCDVGSSAASRCAYCNWALCQLQTQRRSSTPGPFSSSALVGRSPPRPPRPDTLCLQESEETIAVTADADVPARTSSLAATSSVPAAPVTTDATDVPARTSSPDMAIQSDAVSTSAAPAAPTVADVDNAIKSAADNASLLVDDPARTVLSLAVSRHLTKLCTEGKQVTNWNVRPRAWREQTFL